MFLLKRFLFSEKKVTVAKITLSGIQSVRISLICNLHTNAIGIPKENPEYRHILFPLK